MIRVVCLVLLVFIFSVSSFAFNSFKYLDVITVGSEGFSQPTKIFNSYSSSLFTSPQWLGLNNEYSLGMFLNNFIGGPLFSFSGHFKILEQPLILGLSTLNSSSEVYTSSLENIGYFNQLFFLFGLGSSFKSILSTGVGELDIGSSLLFSIDYWTFPPNLFVLDTYYFEFYTIPLLGISFRTFYNLDVSLVQKVFIGHFLSVNSFGFDTEFGLRFYPVSLFSENKDIYKYFVLYPYFSYGYITTFPEGSRYRNEHNNLVFGLTATSEPIDGLKVAFGFDNNGWSLSILLNFFSSPLGIGNMSYQGMSYDMPPSFYIVLTERTVKQVLGVTPDREEVEKGIVQFERGNYTEANRHFEKALKYNPSNEVALIYIQKLKIRLESDDMLTEEQREYIKTLLARAKVLTSQNKYGEALREYRKVIEVNPYNKEALDGIKQIESVVQEEVNKNYREALSLYSRNELLEARKVINRNFDLNPFHDPSVRLSKEIEDRIQSETTKKLELEQRRTLSYSLYSQGMQEFSSYNFSKALELFNKALEVYPENKEAEEAVKNTLREIEASTRIQQNRSRSDSLVSEGIRLRNEKRYWDAIGKFREAIRFFRENEKARNELSSTIEIIKADAKNLEKEGDELFVQSEFSRAFDKWYSAVMVLGELPEAISLKQKIESKRAELRSSIDIKLANAREFLNNRDFTNAIKTLDAVLKIEPTNKQANELYPQAKRMFDEYVSKRYNEGLRLYNNKDYQNSLSVFEELLSLIPESDARYPNIRTYYNESKKKVDEMNVARRVEEKIRESDALLVNYDYDGAKKVLEDALKLDPNNEQLKRKLKEIDIKSKEIALRDEANKLLGFGLREVRRKNYVEGISKLKEARSKFLTLGDDVSLVDSYIKSAEEEYNLEKNQSFIEGKKAYERGDYLKAKELLEVALRNNPESSEIKFLLTEVNNKLRVVEKQMFERADNYYRSGDYDRALEDYNSLVKISPENDLYRFRIENIQKIKEDFNEANNLFRVGEYSEALDIVEELLGLNPSDPNLQRFRDTIMERLFARISSLRNEADELIKKEDYRKAISRLKTILKYSPNDSEVKSKLSFAEAKLSERVSRNFTSGRNAYNAGNYREAIRLLQVVLDDDPANVSARNLLNDARAKYNQVVVKDREKIQRDVASFISKGVEEYRKGNVNKAIEYWQRVLEIDPGNDQARKYIARAKLGR